jgi:hypothetical protein
MKYIILLLCFCTICLNAAVQYNTKGNQGWLTFDSDTVLSFDLDRSGKDKNHYNFIDRGGSVIDYGWYNLETGETGSFNNGLTANFKETDKIGLYVTDNKGTYLSTKPKKPFENDIWGKSKLVDGSLYIAGGNLGSNGTHEYYVFKIKTNNSGNNTPNGQPLPGIIATLLIGGASIWYLKNRKKLLV